MVKNKNTFPDNSLSNQIAEKITHEIITGKLEPGEKIIESAYAEEFGTSRAPIRESLYLLATEGLIERIPRKGAVVKDYSEAEIYDICEVRMVLESLAMKRIKQNGVKHEVQNKMDDIVDKMELAKDDITEYTYLNQELHKCIIEMSGSNIISDMYWRLGRPLLTLQRISFLQEQYIEKSLEDHKEIIQLLLINDFDKASALLEKHNQDVIQRII
ncbi:GntR family transcriptional regulator [Oceanobacillus halotolerans]|uniref:GntR family transcriptional regulator n=1 Tax=Oceanobacillus halotolerans TaxID=2663380 RepID=UPI0013D8E4E7|nr:GntR family transcriptional regulator [Oceanobacillus halotolerans]